MKLNRVVWILIIIAFGFLGLGCDKKEPAEPEKSTGTKEALFPDTPYVPEPVVLDYDKSYFDKNRSVDKEKFIDDFMDGYWEKNMFLWAKSCGNECIPLIEKRINESGNYSGRNIFNLMFMLGAIGDDSAVPVFDKMIKYSIHLKNAYFSAIDGALFGLALVAGQGGEKSLDYLYDSCFIKNWRKRFPERISRKDAKYVQNTLFERAPKMAIMCLGKSGAEKGLKYLLDIVEHPEGYLEPEGEEGIKSAIAHAEEGLKYYSFIKQMGFEVFRGQDDLNPDQVLDAYLSSSFPNTYRFFTVKTGYLYTEDRPEFQEILWKRLKDGSREKEWPLIVELLGWQQNPFDSSRLIAFTDERLMGKLNPNRAEALLKIPVTLGFLASNLHEKQRPASKKAFKSLLSLCESDITVTRKIEHPSSFVDQEEVSFSDRWKGQCAEGLAVTGKQEAKSELILMKKNSKEGTALRKGVEKALETLVRVSEKGARNAYPWDYRRAQKKLLEQYRSFEQ